ncbi:hypothetical protein [Nonomuraea dietziae]|uniref:Uncharacterized protein n=1 Tax=Nonomuraea dietziae TaxID=65515 RepID=A0A7W5UV58_9ACTN|nr:hypothetical protein [Nonomuraea dietziae]MBB3725221.1 hypothetical protein [Nonomuraea dietziae]
MPMLLKAVLAGAAIGASQVLILVFWPHDVDNEFTGVAVMMFAPFPLAFLLSWAARMPRWPIVGLSTPFVMLVFAMVMGAGMQWLPDSPVSLAIPAVIGFPFTAWLCAPGNRMARIAAAGTVLLALCAAPLVSKAIQAAEVIGDMKSSGIPLVAPAIPNYRLDSVDPTWLPEMIGFTYHPTDDHGSGRWVEVYVRPGGAASPEAACADPMPDWSWKTVTPCRQIAPGVWTTRLENGYTPVYARHGEALVQVGGYDAITEDFLLSVLPTFRPITAVEIAAAS